MDPYYPLSESEKKASESINSQTKFSTTSSQTAGFASILFSSGSPLFVQGLMLAEIILLLKYVNINYPPIVLQMFNSQSKSPTLLFHFTFLDDKRDSNILPSLFEHYYVSIYFLNNVGEILFELVCIILIAIVSFKDNSLLFFSGSKVTLLMKILVFIRDVIVWEATLFFILMNLQKLIFFSLCSLMFPPINSTNALINLFLSSFVALFIVLWLIHLGVIIKVCHKLKINEEKKQKENNSENQDIDSSINSKSQRSKYFP